MSDIIFVADNDLEETEIEKIKNLTIHQICLHHGEYDFGSYKRGWLYVKKMGLLKNYDDLILANDSVFGPFYSFSDIIYKMNKKDCDFWGMFKNNNIKDHIQSYFIYFKKNLLKTGLIDDFMNNIVAAKKLDIILNYEIGLSSQLINKGYKCEGLFENFKKAPQNDYALKLIKEGFPFLKKGLFVSKNFCDFVYCQNLYKWEKVIKESNKNYDTKIIKNYLLSRKETAHYQCYLFLLRFHIMNLKNIFKNFIFSIDSLEKRWVIRICGIKLKIKKHSHANATKNK